MIRLITAEVYRMLASRWWIWTLLAAIILGAGFTSLFTLVGPENFDPPMPSLETEEGVQMMLGLTTLTLVVPALIGALIVTGEYRHHTISHTFLSEPRRGRVLAAKMFALALMGLGYGLLVSAMTVGSLYGAAATAGITLGAPLGQILTALTSATAAIIAYTLIGAAVGALVRNQLVAAGVLIGYFSFGEVVLLALPGLNSVYPYLPGGASSALTNFSYLADTIAAETGASTTLLPPAAGFGVLLAYAVTASAVAMATSLQRDVT